MSEKEGIKRHYTGIRAFWDDGEFTDFGIFIFICRWTAVCLSKTFVELTVYGWSRFTSRYCVQSDCWIVDLKTNASHWHEDKHTTNKQTKKELSWTQCNILKRDWPCQNVKGSLGSIFIGKTFELRIQNYRYTFFFMSYDWWYIGKRVWGRAY